MWGAAAILGGAAALAATYGWRGVAAVAVLFGVMALALPRK